MKSSKNFQKLEKKVGIFYSKNLKQPDEILTQKSQKV